MGPGIRRKKPPSGNVRDVLHRIVDYSRNPSWLVELYYWSLEPGLMQMVRQYLALPGEVRDALRVFLIVAAENPSYVTAKVGKHGQVTLASPYVAQADRMEIVAGQEGKAVH